MLKKLVCIVACVLSVQSQAQTSQAHIHEECASRMWILMHTKPCPNCAVRIEKNGGCDYIQCTQCGYEFCWNCAAPHNHATHVCIKRARRRDPHLGK